MNRSKFLGSGLALTGAGLLSSCSTQLAHSAIETASPQTLQHVVRPNIVSADSEMSATLKNLKVEGYQEAGSNDLIWSRYAVTRPPTLMEPNTIITAPRQVIKPNLVLAGGNDPAYNCFDYGWGGGDGSYGSSHTVDFVYTGNESGHAVFYDNSGSYSGGTFLQTVGRCDQEILGVLSAGAALASVILKNSPAVGSKITDIGAKYLALGATVARAAAFILEIFAVATVTQWLFLGSLVLGLVAIGIGLGKCLGTKTSYRQGSLRLA